MNTLEFAAFVGIDWADEEHAVCLLEPGREAAAQHARLPQQAGAIADWAQGLAERYGGRPVAVCLEMSRGALIYALMKYPQLVLFPLNPKQLAKYRQALSPGGAKDDPGDAELLASFLARHHQRLRAWRPDDALTRSLRLLCEARRSAVDDRTALGNRLLQHLKEAYPLALSLVGKHVYNAALLSLLARFPSERELRRGAPRVVTKYLPKRRRAAGDDDVDARIAAWRASPTLVVDEAVLQHSRLAVKHLVAQLKQLNAMIAEYDEEIAKLMTQHPDAQLFASFSGAGPALTPRLVAAFGSDRSRYASADELQQLSGVAPITVQSGKSRQVRMRRACPRFLRQTFHEFARCSLKTSRWAKAYYELLRAKGHKFHSAVRALAYKWIRILFRCWQTRKHYDEDRYLKSLRLQNSPLLKFLPPPKITPTA
jgi:transposase